MVINYRKKFRINNFAILTIGLAIVAVSIWVILLILKEVYGRYEISDIMPQKRNLIAPFTEKKVAILYSRHTEILFPEGSSWLKNNVDTWRKFINTTEFQCEVISDRTIEEGKHFNYKLIILPSSEALTDEEIIQLKKYLDNGGSIFATRATGSTTENGDWRGWGFLSETFGIQFTKEVPSDRIIKIHTLRGSLPLTSGLPTGYTFQIATWDRPMACAVLEPRTKQVSFWYDYRKDPGLVEEELPKSAGIVYGKYGKGRFIWMGFELNSITGEQKDYIYFDKFFQNSINWLTQTPTVIIKDWPSNYNAAAIITLLLSEKTPNISKILDVTRTGIPMTFLIHPDLAKTDKAFVKELARYGDLNVVADLGYLTSPENPTIQMYDYQTQLAQLKQAKQIVEQQAAVKIHGASPLYGCYDQYTIHALISAGYEYIISDSLRDRAVPEIQIKGKNSIVSFTKTSRDDYDIIQKYGLTEPDFQLYTYLEDITRVLFQGGLYILKLHSEYQIHPQYAEVIKKLIQYMQERDLWITTASEIKAWWTSRNALEVSLQTRSLRRVALAVSNAGKKDVKDFVIQINLNKAVKNIEISSDIFGTPIPQYTFDESNYNLDLEFGSLEPGKTLTYLVDYDIANP